MQRRHTLIGMAVLAAIASAVPISSASAADATKTCDANHHLSGKVTGPVAVPAYSDCQLSGVSITGGITVGANATLATHSHTAIYGNISVGTGGALLLVNTVTHGDIRADAVTAVTAITSVVTGSVTGSLLAPNGNPQTGLDLNATRVQGRVAFSGQGATDTVTISEGSSIGQGAAFSNTRVVIGESTVSHYLTLDGLTDVSGEFGAAGGSQIGALTVQGTLTLSNSSGFIELGDAGYGATMTVDGTLRVLDNTARVQISGLVRGDVVCKRNHPAPTVGDTNVVIYGKSIGGQCNNFPPPD